MELNKPEFYRNLFSFRRFNGGSTAVWWGDYIAKSWKHVIHSIIHYATGLF